MTLIGLSLLMFAGMAGILLFLIYIAYPKKSVLQERIETLQQKPETALTADPLK